MDRETVILFGAVVIIGALFGAIYAVGLQPSLPDRSGGVTTPLDVDIPPEVIIDLRDDPPPPRFSAKPLTPDRPQFPPNEMLEPPPPGPNDIIEPPSDNPEDCIAMEFVSPPANATAGEAFALLLHEHARTPDYKGNVINFLSISPAGSKDVIAQVPLQHGEPPFRSVDVEMTDGDGHAYGPLLDLSSNGKDLLGYTWTPRQGAEWWLPIDLSLLEAGEYTISMAAYDSTTCVRIAEDIAITIEVERVVRQ